MDTERSISDFNRRTIGAIFGTLIGIAIVWGSTGGWDWFYLIGIPTNIDFRSDIFAMFIGGIIGWINGLLIAWPRTMRSPAGWKIIGLLMGLYTLLFIPMGFQRSSEVEAIYLVALISWWTLIPAFVLIRISISLVERATFFHSDLLPLRVLIIGICVCTITVMATWPLDYGGALLGGRRAILIKAAEISHEMDWNVIHFEVLATKPFWGFLGMEYQHPGEIRLVFTTGHSIDCTFEGENSMYCPGFGVVP